MRTARIVEEGAAYYHITSRTLDRRYVFDDAEKERGRKTMRAVEGFTGCEIRTYAILSNHGHVLLYVPQWQEITDAELGRRLGVLYDSTVVENVMGHLTRLRENGQLEAVESLKLQYTRRMYRLFEFGKMFKQRVSYSYNRRHGRKGTLWAERFGSVLMGESVPGFSSIRLFGPPALLFRPQSRNYKPKHQGAENVLARTLAASVTR